MEDVNISIYRASVVREGSTPASPGFVVSDGQNPVDPSGSGQNHLPVTIATAATGLSITESQVLGGAGNVGQYIRGDGSLADFPESSGGGSSVSYYLNGSVAQGTIGGVAYKELNKVPILGAGTDFTINADGYIASFITDAGDPNLLEIPGGNWNFETYFSASSSGGSPTFYVELYKVNSGGTATLIASNSGFPELIAFGTNIISYFSTLAVPTTALALTDRLAIRYYVTHSGRTITLHTEDNHLCQIITTFTTGLTALNGLTAQIQNFAVGTSGTDFAISSATATHTFNLPTASATNRGALSSADWSMFNAKQNALTNPVTGTGTTNYLTKFTGASTIGNSVIQESSSNIGIGVGPSFPLDLLTSSAGTFNTIVQFYNSNFTSGNRSFLRVRQQINAGSSYSSYFGTGQDGNLYVIANDSARGGDLVINANTGNVLVGTNTDSGSRLEVAGGGIFSLLLSGNITDATRKFAFIQGKHYTNSEEPIAMIGIDSQVSSSILYIGGGLSSGLNAVSGISFQTAANNTTVTGTERMIINSSGQIGMSHNPNASYGTLQIKAPAGVYSLDLVGRTAGLNGESQISFWNAAQSSVLAYLTNTGSNLYIGTGANQPFTLSSGGNFIFGSSTDNGARLQVSGTATFSSSVSGTSIRSSAVGSFGFNTANNGEFQIYATAANGMIMAGRGSSTDMVITNKNGADVFTIPTGTTIANFTGNVGIGTASPSGAAGLALAMNSGANQCRIALKTSATGDASGDGLQIGIAGIDAFIEQRENASLTFATNASERFRINSEGFSKASNTGAYAGSTGLFHEFITNQTNNNIAYFWNTAASPYGPYFRFSTVAPNNGTNYYLYCDDTSTVRFIVYSNGGISNYQANNTNLSDERTKKEISPLESYWDKFKAIEIVKFKYKDQTHNDFNIGVIAQQVEKVAPEFVDVDGWDNKTEGNEVVSQEEPIKSIYTADLHHATIKVLQEAMAKIEAMQKEIDTLKN